MWTLSSEQNQLSYTVLNIIYCYSCMYNEAWICKIQTSKRTWNISKNTVQMCFILVLMPAAVCVASTYVSSGYSVLGSAVRQDDQTN